jgi:hypothetical protein
MHEEPNEVKLRRVRQHFLSRKSRFHFYTVLYLQDNDETGYYFSLLAPNDFEYSTFLDNVYLQSNTARGIIDTIESELNRMVLDENDAPT